MVATLLGLRWTSLRRNLRREPWRLVLLVLGALWALTLLPPLVGGGYWLGVRPPGDVETVLVIVGAALTIGWATAPVLLPGLDDTLDIERFATFGLPARRLVPGLLAAAVLGLPTLVTGAVTLVPVLTWVRAGEPGAVAVAVVAAPLAWLTCLTAARVSTATMRRVLVTRRARHLAIATGLVMLGAGVFAARAGARIGLERALELLPDLPTLLGWTPVAAAWAAPAVAAQGDLVGAVGRLAVATASVALGLGWWTRSLQRWMVSPPARADRPRRRRDALLPARFAPPGHRPGWDAAAAIARRGLRSWAADPRYLGSLLSAIGLPVVLMVLAAAVLGEADQVVILVAVAMAASIGWGRHNDVAFDGTALWLHVTAAVPGWADRLGRTVATAVWAVPLVAGVGALGVVVTGNAELAPAVAGTAVGVLLAGLAASALLSALLPYPVPAAGENPFATQPGAVGAGLVAQAVAIAVTGVAALPAVALLVLSLTVAPGLAPWTAVLGPVLGVAMLAAGVVFGGRVYDLRVARILARLG